MLYQLKPVLVTLERDPSPIPLHSRQNDRSTDQPRPTSKVERSTSMLTKGSTGWLFEDYHFTSNSVRFFKCAYSGWWCSPNESRTPPSWKRTWFVMVCLIYSLCSLSLSCQVLSPVEFSVVLFYLRFSSAPPSNHPSRSYPRHSYLYWTQRWYAFEPLKDRSRFHVGQ